MGAGGGGDKDINPQIENLSAAMDPLGTLNPPALNRQSLLNPDPIFGAIQRKAASTGGYLSQL